MQLTLSQIRSFALIMFALTFVTAIIYVTVQLYRDGHELKLKRIILTTVTIFVLIGAGFYLYFHLPATTQQAISRSISTLAVVSRYASATLVACLFAASLFRLIRGKRNHTSDIYWAAYFTPVIPLFLILVFSMNFIAAFICGLVYGFVSTYQKNSLNQLIQSILEGGGVVMPAIVLMLGIGMLLNAIMGPGGEWAASHPQGWPVLNLLQPLMARIIPQNELYFILVFGLAAPLALYRGPLNVWGMGYGLAAIFLASGMNPAAVMGLLMAVGPVQGISDPTNTHNVWLANEMQLDVQKVLWNTIPYTWSLAIVALVVAAGLFV
jgi:hypothetical protein